MRLEASQVCNLPFLGVEHANWCGSGFAQPTACPANYPDELVLLLHTINKVK